METNIFFVASSTLDMDFKTEDVTLTGKTNLLSPRNSGTEDINVN